ncbi:MAG: O-antigen ligase family protein [Verrucomicrobia bacterium]|nr:O-antigen ligase family protein [Verrucomicrobiota bacterium]
MAISEPTGTRDEPFDPSAVPESEPRHRHRRSSHRPRTPRLYELCDWATEGVLYFMVVFGPWAYGTTQTWSTWTMNWAAFAIGALLLTKWAVRWRTGYQPVRWGQTAGRMRDEAQRTGGESKTSTDQSPTANLPSPAGRFLTLVLATLTGVVLSYCLVSSLNARATYDPTRRLFEFHDCLEWLPHSYDSRSTWFVFWQYLGLAFVFWAVRDWLLGKSRPERRTAMEGPPSTAAPALSDLEPTSANPRLPARLQRLFWVVCVNGAVLALECILQRLSGTGKLLWIRQPYWNTEAISQFGPFAYRGNAAEYLNLIWPVCLAFWWALRRVARFSPRRTVRAGSGPHVVLLPCAVLTAAGPIISTARGGALTATGGILLATALLLWRTRRGGWLSRVGVITLFLVIISLAGYLGWTQLEQRLKTIFTDEMSGRVELYQNAHKMAEDFPWLGSGPGTFGPLYQEYRAGLNQVWEVWAHNDWLETRITFGRIGLTLVLLMLALALGRWFAGGGIPLPRTAVHLMWVAIGACLLYARFDFPLQVYSILFVFILWCSVLFCLSRQPRA